MNLLLDPLSDVLLKYRTTVVLGREDPTEKKKELDKDRLLRDLEIAKKRNNYRFHLTTGLLCLGSLIVLLFAFFYPNGSSPEWLLGSSGIYSGGLGVFLLQVNRSWWRTDMLITVAKHSSPSTMEKILKELLAAELRS